MFGWTLGVNQRQTAGCFVWSWYLHQLQPTPKTASKKVWNHCCCGGGYVRGRLFSTAMNISRMTGIQPKLLEGSYPIAKPRPKKTKPGKPGKNPLKSEVEQDSVLLQRFKPMDEVENTVVELLQHVKVEGFWVLWNETKTTENGRLVDAKWIQMVAYTDTYYHYSILFNTFQRCETSTKTDLVCLKTYVTCFFLMYVYDLRVCIYIYTYHIYIYIYIYIRQYLL